MLVVVLLLMFLSVVVGGLAYWKKDELFQGGGNNDQLLSEGDGDNVEFSEKTLGESCVISSECEASLVCDPDSFTCQPISVPVDCEGSFGEWSECVYPDGDACVTVGTRTRRFVKTNDGPKHGGAECPAVTNESETCGGRAVPSTCNVDCVGEWELATCPSNQCGDTTMTETYRVTANAVGTGNDCLHADGDTRQKDCPNPCTGPPENCEGDWAPENCGYRGCGQPSLTKTKSWVKTKDAKNGGSCPLENQTQSYTCPATNACHRGEDPRPGNLRARHLFKNSDKKVQIFKFDGDDKKCLGVGGGDDVVGQNDSVGFHDCDRKHADRLNTWRIKDNNYIETWHTTSKFRKNGRDQPLCLDWNGWNNNSSFKVTRCDRWTGNDKKNRTQELRDHDKMTWPRQSNLVHDAATYRQWSNIAPVKIRTGHSNKCIRNAGGGSKAVGDCNANEELYITDQTF